MKRTMLACAILLASLAAGISALAEPPAAAARRDTEPSVTLETVRKGNERYLAKDWSGAVDLYKKAIAMSPKDPLPRYVLGEAYLAADNLREAEAALHDASELSDSKDARSAALRSHVLFSVADCFERQKKWAEAKTAWQAYLDHAAKVPDAGAFPASGKARIEVIDARLAREAAYAAVRERIAAEKDAGAKKKK